MLRSTLTRRWATEDPNPQEKIDEQKRIAAQGQEAIKGMLDENLIEATQALRALEDGDEEDFYPIEASAPDGDDDEPAAKRVKGSNGAAARIEAAPAPTPDMGMLKGDALDNIRYYAEMARKQAEEDRKRKVPEVKKVGMAGLLGGYSSGDESD